MFLIWLETALRNVASGISDSLILSTKCFLLDGVVFSNLFHQKSSKVKLPSDLQLIKHIIWLECPNLLCHEIQHNIPSF